MMGTDDIDAQCLIVVAKTKTITDDIDAHCYCFCFCNHNQALLTDGQLRGGESKHLKGRSVPPLGNGFGPTKDFVLFLFLDTFRIPKAGQSLVWSKSFNVCL